MKNKYKICISILCMIILFPIVANARYFEKIENIKGKGTIAEPIFKVQSLQNTITETINKKSGIKEYVFIVRNYELEADGISKRISQVDMEYNIEIINETSNFPIKYELYEIENSENILNEKGKTSNFTISKDIEYEKTYKLIVFWENKDGVLDNIDNIKILINSSQIK